MRPQRTTVLLVSILAAFVGYAALAQVPAAAQALEIAAASEPAPLPDAPFPAIAFAPSPAASPASSAASVAGDAPLEQQPHPAVKGVDLPLHMLNDGEHIVVSPIYLRRSDLKWLLPLTGAAAAAFATDTHTMTQVVSSNASFNQANVNLSNGLVYGMIALPASMFVVGEASPQHDHARETGILGGEAIGDAYIVDQIVKLCAWRERPYQDNGQGEFFIGNAGADSSFVSSHSMVAWSSAAVIAGEYHSRWVQLGVYTAAAGVSATRVMGQQHFPSDVLLGAASGWLVGHYVFRAHHHWVPQAEH